MEPVDRSRWCWLALTALGALVACGPAPGWVEEPEEQAPPAVLPASDVPSGPGATGAGCSISTPAARLQGRMSRQTSVEGMNTLACPSPSEPGR